MTVPLRNRSYDPFDPLSFPEMTNRRVNANKSAALHQANKLTKGYQAIHMPEPYQENKRGETHQANKRPEWQGRTYSDLTNSEMNDEQNGMVVVAVVAVALFLTSMFYFIYSLEINEDCLNGKYVCSPPI